MPRDDCFKIVSAAKFALKQTITPRRYFTVDFECCMLILFRIYVMLFFVPGVHYARISTKEVRGSTDTSLPFGVGPTSFNIHKDLGMSFLLTFFSQLR